MITNYLHQIYHASYTLFASGYSAVCHLKERISQLFQRIVMHFCSPNAVDVASKKIVDISGSKPSITSVARTALGKGMANSGNSCYMAATLQALLQTYLAKQEYGKTDPIFPLKALLPNEKTLSKSETEKLRHFFNDLGWKEVNRTNKMGDADLFLEFLLPLLKVPNFPITAKKTRTNPTDTDIVGVAHRTNKETSTKELLAPFKLFENNAPRLLPFLVKRARDCETGAIEASKQVEFSEVKHPEKKIKYDLKAVIIYITNIHYYTLVPQEGGSWIEYNDSVVTTRSAAEVDTALKTKGYIYLYEQA
jgi:hypothetical protein